MPRTEDSLSIEIKIADAEQVKQILAAANGLSDRVAWVLNDAAFAAPEAYERHARNYRVLEEALREFRTTVAAQTDREPASADLSSHIRKLKQGG